MHALHHAFRQLRQHPGFSAVVIVMLAVGIGATTAMFSMFYQVLRSNLAVEQPERLVNLGAPGPKPGGTTCTMAGDCEQVFSYPMFRDLQARQTVLSELAGHYATFANLSYRNQTQSSRALLVSGGYFPALRIRPALGRLIGPQDDAHVGESAVAVLSYDYWQSSLGADPNVLGQTLVVNGQALTIVGVAPDGFSGTTFGWRPSVFVPLTMRWLMESNVPRSDNDRRAYWVYAFGRLAPGVSLEQARAALNTLYSGIINEVEAPLNGDLPDEAMARFRARPITVEPGARGQSIAQTLTGPVFVMLLGVAAVVLIVVCFNVANLMLVRGATRTGEMAIRSSLGANRTQLLRDLLLESAALATAGGLASIPVAVATLRGVSALVPAQLAGQLVMKLEPAATVFAAALSLGTVLLFGLLPALRASRARPGAATQMQARNTVGARGGLRFGRSLATIQVVLSMLLLVVGGLFAQSLVNLARADLGMNVDSLVTFSVSPRRNGYSNPQGMQLFDTLERELAAQPGVTSVGSSMVPLLSLANWGGVVKIDGYDLGPAADSRASTNEVNEGFFRTLSIPVLAGRSFTEADAIDTRHVAIVNEAFVRKFHLEDGAIGKRVSIEDRPLTDMEVVGVIADAKYSTVWDDVPPQVITPRRQDENLGALVFYVRAALPPGDVMRSIRRVVAAADPNLPVTDLLTMGKVVDDNLFTQRLIAILSGGLAALATLLTATGLYGVLAYSVAQRTRELGLRLALGATAAGLRTMVLKQVATIALIGMPIGLALGVALGQAAKALLFELKGYDPIVLAGAVVLLTGVVLAAGYLPARRASSVEPMEALRYE
jgi:putative ABC transport system permease protein